MTPARKEPDYNKLIRQIAAVCGAILTIGGATAITWNAWARPAVQRDINTILDKHKGEEQLRFDKIDQHYIDIINRLARMEGKLN